MLSIRRLSSLVLALVVFATGCAAPVDQRQKPPARGLTAVSSAPPAPAAPQGQSEQKPAPAQASTTNTLGAPPKQEVKVEAPPQPKPAVNITSITSPIRRGANATVRAETAPGANCSISVIYKSGASTAGGLFTKPADGQGKVSWTWMVGTRTTAGSWPVIITCNGATATTNINVN